MSKTPEPPLGRRTNPPSTLATIGRFLLVLVIAGFTLAVLAFGTCLLMLAVR